jgi:hypothetical protein
MGGADAAHMLLSIRRQNLHDHVWRLAVQVPIDGAVARIVGHLQQVHQIELRIDVQGGNDRLIFVILPGRQHGMVWKSWCWLSQRNRSNTNSRPVREHGSPAPPLRLDHDHRRPNRQQRMRRNPVRTRPAPQFHRAKRVLAEISLSRNVAAKQP